MLVVPRADFIDALDSDRYRIQWITGAYILGSATGMVLTRFAGSRLGLRYAYLLGLVCFTLAGSACAGSTEVFWMAPLRLAQGVGNGLIISVGMVLIWRAFAVHKGLAMALYGMAIQLSAVAGVTLGGLLTALLSWRLIFVLLLPLGSLAGLAAWWLLPPDRSKAEHPADFDLIGFGLLASSIVTLSVVLDMGQYWGWLASLEFVPWLAGLIVSLVGFVLWGVLAPNPLIGLRPLAKPNFALGLGIKALFSVNLVVLLSLVANYMVNLRGYQWWQASLVIAPALGTMLTSLVLGVLLGTDRNRKLRMFAGLAVMAGGTAAFMTVDLYTAKVLQAVYLTLWGAGAGLVIGPALLTAFEGLSTEETLRTAGVFNVLRTLPAFVGGMVLATLLTQGADAQFDVLRQNIRYNRPIVAESLRRQQRDFDSHGSLAEAANKQAHATLARWVHANSRAFALQGIFEYLSLVPAVGLVLVLLVRVKAASGAGRLPR